MTEKYVGQRIKRTEDPRLIKGLAHYVDDIRLPDTLHVSFVRSVYAHARISSIDTTEALKAPGVVAVYTGKDIGDKIGPVLTVWMPIRTSMLRKSIGGIWRRYTRDALFRPQLHEPIKEGGRSRRQEAVRTKFDISHLTSFIVIFSDLISCSFV